MTTIDISVAPQKRAYTAEEIAVMYDLVSVDQVWKLARANKIAGAFKIGNVWRFSRATVDAQLNGEKAA